MTWVDFARLFDGNHLAYGGDEGRAVRCNVTEWQTAIRKHYDGSGPAVGVYPLFDNGEGSHNAPRWLVKWGCVDFDIKSPGHEKYDYETEELANTAAMNLQKVLRAFQIAGWIERTRSHGRHVWVFADSWVPARTMREALLVATDIAGVSQREVNPKSDGSNLETGQLGNYVRLPCNGERQIIDMKPDQFVDSATAMRSTFDTLQRVADLYQPPLPVIEWETTGLDEYNGKVPRVVRHVIENGPNDGDRSKGLLYIAHECKKAGLSPQHALELVMIADDAWGKYTGRRDREQRLIEIVERAWT